jgi:aminopeptidase N
VSGTRSERITAPAAASMRSVSSSRVSRPSAAASRRRSAQAAFDAAYATPDTNTGFWNPPPADPGDAASIFDGTIYTRGAMTLQALRQKIGDADFFELLQTWYARHKYGNASTEDFTALAEEVSGQDLNHFFGVWLYAPGKPAPGSW